MKYVLNGRGVSREEWLGEPARARERFDQMVESGSPPMSNTDREFLQGRGGCYDQFDGNGLVGDFHRQSARRAGVDTTGKLYLSGLARYPGDPQAWVAGRGDVQRVCEARGWGCDGSVKVPLREPDSPPKRGLASDLVDGLVERRLEALPPGEKVDLGELRHEVVQRHAPQGAKVEIG